MSIISTNDIIYDLDSKFDSIRPYAGKEIELALERLSQSGEFLALMSHLTKMDTATIAGLLKKSHNRDDFQSAFFEPIIKAIVQNSSDGYEIKGLEHLPKDKTYLFLSNHRDIILDSAILNLALRDQGFKYTQAAIGSNLFVNEWVTDLVKLDSCFTIERDIPVREMIVSSALRSEYIREILQQGDDSIWIAQREGRTKNGDDKTQTGLLKMLKMSGSKEFAANLRELRIVPLSISYEWEPCDYLKTEELYIRSIREYVKAPGTDMRSMQTGLEDYKGRICFVLDKPIDIELDEIEQLSSNGERLAALAKYIDSRIHRNFKLWPNNYIAYDLLHAESRFADKYTEEEKERFIKTMKRKLDTLDGDNALFHKNFLEIYANPVSNKMKVDGV